MESNDKVEPEEEGDKVNSSGAHNSSTSFSSNQNV